MWVLTVESCPHQCQGVATFSPPTVFSDLKQACLFSSIYTGSMTQNISAELLGLFLGKKCCYYKLCKRNTLRKPDLMTWQPRQWESLSGDEWLTFWFTFVLFWYQRSKNKQRNIRKSGMKIYVINNSRSVSPTDWP